MFIFPLYWLNSSQIWLLRTVRNIDRDTDTEDIISCTDSDCRTWDYAQGQIGDGTSNIYSLFGATILIRLSLQYCDINDYIVFPPREGKRMRAMAGLTCPS